MTAVIRGGTSGIDAEVDSASKAQRVTLYDANGNPLEPAAAYSASAIIKVRQSAATGAGVVVWGIHNPHATKIIHIRRILLELFFDGTAAATLMEYEIGRMTGITTFSGGALVTPCHKKTSEAAAQVSVARILDTGLTTTGGTFQSQLLVQKMGRVTQTATNSQAAQSPLVLLANVDGNVMQLAQNEALVIRQLVVSVIGDRVQGSVDFAEV